MSSGQEMYIAIKKSTSDLPKGSEFWINVNDKYDLCKLTAADLRDLGYGEKADLIASALNDQNLMPLGEGMGIFLKVKFRLLAERTENSCRIMCGDLADCEWLRGYLLQQFPGNDIKPPVVVDGSFKACIEVKFSNQITPYSLWFSLVNCPAATVIKIYEVRIAEQPHYVIESYNLAAWLEDHDENTWWTVDGDPILMSRLEFPAPSDELAAEIMKLEKRLLVADPKGNAMGEELTPEDVDSVMVTDEHGESMLLLSWVGGSTDWQLMKEPI